MSKKLLRVFIIIAILVAGAAIWYSKECEGADCNPKPTVDPSMIKSFADCEAAGYPVMESYPRMCKAGNTTYVEQIDQ